MTNRIAFWLGLILVCAIIIDVMGFGSQHMVFLGQKLFDLIEWLAFWR